MNRMGREELKAMIVHSEKHSFGAILAVPPRAQKLLKYLLSAQENGQRILAPILP